MVEKTSGLTSLFAAASLATALIGSPSAHAQEPAKAYVVSYIETMPNRQNEAVRLIRDYVANGRKAPGLLFYFEALRRIDRPNQFALLSTWKDQSAAESFAASDATKQFHDKLQPLLIAPQDDRPSTGLDIGPVIPKDKGSDKVLVYAVTHVDLIPPKKDEGIIALKENAGPSREDPGNRRYDLLQQNSRGNHFTLVEVWDSRISLEMHEAAAHTRKLRDLLFPMGGALYDQRLYHPLD